jgi:hypothetical protein
MENQKIYEIVDEITKSQEYTQSDCPSKGDAMETINLLRKDIKTLVNIIYECGSELKDAKKVAEMLQRVEKAKSRFLERAVDNALKDDHYDIMPYDARKSTPQKLLSIGNGCKVGKIDIED